jgi:SAM-dependent methyltransferase
VTTTRTSTFVSIRSHQFAYFDPQLKHPDWANATVLDFGGNAGNILLDPHCTIDPEKYWCVDLSRDAIKLGRQRNPLGHFVLYNRYNFEYNPTGTPDEPIPDFGRRFDIILAYSVFTHTSRREMRTLVAGLRSLLTDDGVLAFTFIDPNFNPPDGWAREDETPGLDNLLWRLTVSPGTAADAMPLATKARRNPLAWITLVNHETLVVDSGEGWVHKGRERSQYLVFCTERHMRSLYPDAEILPPIRPQRHSCCVLGPTGKTGEV